MPGAPETGSKHWGYASSIWFSLQQLPEHDTNGVVVMTQTARPCRSSHAPTSPLSDSHECSTANLNKVVGEEAVYSWSFPLGTFSKRGNTEKNSREERICVQGPAMCEDGWQLREETPNFHRTNPSTAHCPDPLLTAHMKKAAPNLGFLVKC